MEKMLPLEEKNMKEKHIKSFLMTTMNGMVYGLFATLIIGVIIRQFGTLLNIPLLVNQIWPALSGMLGVGIGLGIGLSLKASGLRLVVISVMGGIASSFTLLLDGTLATGAIANEPLKIYLVTIGGILLINRILVKKTPFDILLIPLTGVVLAILLTLVIGGPVRFMIDQIQLGIAWAMDVAAIPMTIIIAVVMGMLLTAPISSAAIAIAINLGGLAGGAAFIGCSVQMIGFAIHSRKDNTIGVVLSIAFGTSMLQFKNIMRKPIIWLPTIIASAILAPISYLFFKNETSAAGAGMGTSGLVGPLQTLEAMRYSATAWMVVAYTVLGAIVLVYALDRLFRKLAWIEKGDFMVSRDIT